MRENKNRLKILWREAFFCLRRIITASQLSASERLLLRTIWHKQEERKTRARRTQLHPDMALLSFTGLPVRRYV